MVDFVFVGISSISYLISNSCWWTRNCSQHLCSNVLLFYAGFLLCFLRRFQQSFISCQCVYLYFLFLSYGISVGLPLSYEKEWMRGTHLAFSSLAESSSFLASVMSCFPRLLRVTSLFYMSYIRNFLPCHYCTSSHLHTVSSPGFCISFFSITPKVS